MWGEREGAQTGLISTHHYLSWGGEAIAGGEAWVLVVAIYSLGNTQECGDPYLLDIFTCHLVIGI